jgi:hypothetical protein
LQQRPCSQPKVAIIVVVVARRAVAINVSQTSSPIVQYIIVRCAIAIIVDIIVCHAVAIVIIVFHCAVAIYVVNVVARCTVTINVVVIACHAITIIVVIISRHAIAINVSPSSPNKFLLEWKCGRWTKICSRKVMMGGGVLSVGWHDSSRVYHRCHPIPSWEGLEIVRWFHRFCIDCNVNAGGGEIRNW